MSNSKKRDGKWGYVDENRVLAVPIKYDSAGRVYGAFANVTEGDKTSCLHIIRN